MKALVFVTSSFTWLAKAWGTIFSRASADSPVKTSISFLVLAFSQFSYHCTSFFLPFSSLTLPLHICAISWRCFHRSPSCDCFTSFCCTVRRSMLFSALPASFQVASWTFTPAWMFFPSFWFLSIACWISFCNLANFVPAILRRAMVPFAALIWATFVSSCCTTYGVLRPLVLLKALLMFCLHWSTCELSSCCFLWYLSR
mmetsp:Transcript_78620/g.208748  ORF Transcript_78620/g.208748 Transcript_78620/m.208748 type:complete len:200 (-) Transcript_78620:65-664(-)